MKNLLRWLSRRRFPYEPLITVEISKDRLLHNLSEFRKLAPQGQVAPVLKSNAYGHGLIEVASILKHESHIPFFIVDSYFEAVALRAQRIKVPILIIGYTRLDTVANSRLKNTSFTISSLEALEKISGGKMPCWKSAHIQLKIDTGMRRQGLLPEEIDQAINLIKDDPNLILEGICTHFSDADNADTSFTDGQIAVWNRTVKKFRSAFPHLKYIHASATDGHQFTNEIDANISRLGIGLYGLSENRELVKKINLKPVMKIKTIITGVKTLKLGESTGYGNTCVADRDMTIATIPFGYYEGLDRRLSNNGIIQVGDKKAPCPIIGRVSMNITTLDVSAVPRVQIRDEVTVISDEMSDPNSIVSHEKRIGSIAYELVVKIPGHLKRVVV